LPLEQSGLNAGRVLEKNRGAVERLLAAINALAGFGE